MNVSPPTPPASAPAAPPARPERRSARDPIRRWRVPLGFLLGAVYLAVARPLSATVLAVGAVIALAGVLVRGWAAGHIVKNRQLATTGPYAHTRNPLYFGSFLLAFGLCFAAHWALVVVVIAFFLVVYRPTIAHEREFVRGLYPEAYARWEQHVPAFFPRLTPWTEGNPGERQRFSFDRYRRHREWQAGLAYLTVVGWLSARLYWGF